MSGEADRCSETAGEEEVKETAAGLIKWNFKSGYLCLNIRCDFHATSVFDTNLASSH